MNEKPQKTSIKTMLIGAAVLVGIILLTFFVVFRKVDADEVIRILKQVPPAIIVVGICMMFLFSIGEALNMRRPLRMLGYDTTFRQAFKYAIVGFFFSSITPSSTGGQPMQMYYMYQDRVKVSHGLLAILIQLLGYESGSVLLAILGYRFMNPLITETLGRGKYLLLIGIFVNLIFLCFIILCLFSKRAIRLICSLLLKIVGHLKGDGKRKLTDRIENVITEYGSLSGHFKGNMDIVWKTVLTSVLQFICMFLIPFLVYRGLGFHTYGPVQVEMLQAVLYVAVGFIPIPGAAGVSEGTFLLLFRLLFPSNVLAGAMLLSRTMSLYAIIIIYGVILAVISPFALRRKGG